MTSESATLTNHIKLLLADATDVTALLNVHHRDGGDVNPETLGKAERLETSLGEVVEALTHHEHLAMDADDVWHMLSVKHKEREINRPL